MELVLLAKYFKMKNEVMGNYQNFILVHLMSAFQSKKKKKNPCLSVNFIQNKQIKKQKKKLSLWGY